MIPRNTFIRRLFKTIKDRELSKDERNKQAITAIKLIVEQQKLPDDSKKSDPTAVIDLSKVVHLDMTDEKGASPLILAADFGLKDIAKALIEAKADPNNKTKKINTTPLILATINNYGSMVKILLRAEADPNRKNDKTGSFPLSLAAEEGNIKIVTALLKADANPNLVNEETGYTPLILASKKGYFKITTSLLAAKADPNKTFKATDSTPLMIATGHGHTKVVEALLGAKPNIDHLNLFNKSALDYSIHKKNLYLILLLLQSNAKISNFAFLQTYLSSQNQNNPQVLESLTICKQSDTVLFTDASTKNTADLYLEKLSQLYSQYGKLFANFVNELTAPTFLPNDVTNVILSYDGRSFESSAPPIKFLEPVTIDPHLNELNKEIAQKTRRLGLFKPNTIQEMDQSLSEEKHLSTKVSGGKRKRGS